MVSFTKLKELNVMSLLKDTNNYRMIRVNERRVGRVICCFYVKWLLRYSFQEAIMIWVFWFVCLFVCFVLFSLFFLLFYLFTLRKENLKFEIHIHFKQFMKNVF